MTAPTIDADVLRTAINAVRRAMSTDTTRPHLSCLRLDVTPTQITTAATDGHWLARFTCDGDFGGVASLVLTDYCARDLGRWLSNRRARSVFPRRERPPRKGPCEVGVDVEARIVASGFGRFALDVYEGRTPPPDLDTVIPPDTDTPYSGMIAAALVGRIARSFDAAYGGWAGLRFVGDDPQGPARAITGSTKTPERRLLVLCMPVRGPS